MESISQGFGFEKVFTLADSNAGAVEEQITLKATPEVLRVEPSELEYAYIRHPVVFNSINKSVQSIMAADYMLKCEDEGVLTYFKKFITRVGQVGEEVTFDDILESIYQYQYIYGNAYLETVLNKYKNNIVDLVVLDPKRIDYAKKGDGTIVLNKYGKPLGYIQKLPFGVDVTGKGDEVPQGYEINKGTNEIFILPERICHFKLYTYGDRFYGQGIIEAAYPDVLYEMNLKKIIYNSKEKKSPLIDYVGDPLHPPTPAQIQNSLENMRKFKTNRYFAYPYWHKIEEVPTKSDDTTEVYLKYLRESICSSLGMTPALSIGSDNVNRSVIESQQLLLSYTLNYIAKKTTATIQKFIFKRICDYNDFKTVPKLVWGYVGVEETNQKAKRIANYIKAIDPSQDPDLYGKIKNYIIKSEKLD